MPACLIVRFVLWEVRQGQPAELAAAKRFRINPMQIQNTIHHVHMVLLPIETNMLEKAQSS